MTGRPSLSNKLRIFLGASPEGTRGTAAIEFAFVAILLSALLIPAADFGRAIYRGVQVQNGAQAGAQYAIVHGFSSTGISAAAKAATTFTTVTVPAPAQFCGCPSTTGITTQTCGSTCSSGLTAGTYVRVSAQTTLTPVFTYPSVPAQISLGATSTVRIK